MVLTFLSKTNFDHFTNQSKPGIGANQTKLRKRWADIGVEHLVTKTAEVMNSVLSKMNVFFFLYFYFCLKTLFLILFRAYLSKINLISFGNLTPPVNRASTFSKLLDQILHTHSL